MSDDTYCYPPDFTVLRNRFGIRDAVELESVEREFVFERMRQRGPGGDFDLRHLRAIHRHLFQDVYEWAGEIRTIEISKGGNQFQPRRFIETGMANVHARLQAEDFLNGLSPADFALSAGNIIGDVNHAHPFREGNGRTQIVYLAQLARQAGHKIDVGRIDREAWMAASRQSHFGDYAAMGRCIAGALVRSGPDRTRIRRRDD